MPEAVSMTIPQTPPRFNAPQPVYTPYLNDYTRVSVQNYLPVSNKREFTSQEQEQIDAGLNQFWPKIYSSYATPLPQMLANPFEYAACIGTLLGAAGACVGALMNKAQPALGVFLGAAVGIGVGVSSYFQRQQQNENILEIMRRLSPGATKRDLLSDPVYQKDLDRRAMADGNAMNTALMAGMLGNMYSSSSSSSGSRR